jgi:hypothetical protein
MLRLDKNVEPHFGGGGVTTAFEKQQNGIECVDKGTVPHVADEPGGVAYVMGGGGTRRELICHAAADAKSAGSNVHLAELTGGNANNRWMHRRAQPLEIRYSNALDSSHEH